MSQAPRLPFIDEHPDDPVVAEVFDRLRKRWAGGPILHLYRLLGWAPGLLPAWADFAHALRFKTAVSPALRELMIVRSGQLQGCEYEWKHHWPAALEAGVPLAQLHALDDWRGNTLFTPADQAVLALAEETAVGTGASAETLDRLKAALPHQQVAELVVIAGFYAAVGRIVNSLQVPLEPGHETWTPRDETAPGAG